MNILLVGGQQNAYFLSKSLKKKGHEVVVINQDHGWCQSLADRYEIVTVCGNGSNANTLKEAHIEKMDILIALYDQDATNLIVCELAKKQFNVKHTLSIVNDPKNVEIFQGFGVDKCVSITRAFNELIEQYTIEENIKKYLPIEDSRVVIYDLVLTENSPALNKKLWELAFPPQSIIIYVFRGKDIILPQGNTLLLTGDKVVVLSSIQSMEKVLKLLNEKS